jgi:hypothetical protein
VKLIEEIVADLRPLIAGGMISEIMFRAITVFYPAFHLS